MVTIPEVVEALQTVLSTAAEEIARETGFVQRTSKLSGARFTQTLVFGWLANPEASLEELAQTAAGLGVRISPQGLDQRFGPEAAACLEQVLAEAVGTLVVAEPVMIPLLERFSGVYVQDSTSLPLPPSLAEHWPGCGGSRPGAGQASLKLQVRLELRRGTLRGPELTGGRASDRAAALQTAALPPGALRLADLGYFSLGVLRELAAAKVYWLSRYQVQTAVFDAAGVRRELDRWLPTQDSATVDLPISLGQAERLGCRLLAVRLPPAAANARRRKLRAAARAKGQTPSRARLALADWVVLVTNVPPALLSLEEALVLARARWQIELLFKLWKSHGRIDESRSAKPWRVLCEVYAKLLAMVVQHWLFLVGCWAYPDRSLRKAAQTIQKYALALAGGFDWPDRLGAAIATIQRCLAVGCRINRRRAAPASYQLLLQGTTHDPTTDLFALAEDELTA